MNQYRCETCKNHVTDKFCNDWCRSDPIPSHAFIFIRKVGCASHSDFKSERDKVLDNIMELVDARIEGLDSLMATPAEQRTESAQDKYLKEARFELGLVQDEYAELRAGQP